MFLVRKGKTVHLMQSFRDGLGRVRQNSLARFRSLEALQRQWSEVTQLAHQPAEWERLRRRAEQLLEGSQKEADREDKICRQATQLLALLAEGEVQSPQVRQRLQLLAARLNHQQDGELQALSRLSPRRRKYGIAENCAQDYLRQLEGRPTLEVLQRRAALCPDLPGKSAYAQALQEAGQGDSAIKALLELPKSGWRDFNLAALYCREGRLHEAVAALSQGLVQKPGALQRKTDDSYWELYGHLWNEQGRELWSRLSKLQAVRHRLHLLLRGQWRGRSVLKKFSQALFVRAFSSPQ